MRKVKTIAERWREFEKRLMPPNAPPAQRREMKRAFFLGFGECASVFTAELAELSEEDGVEAMESLHQQLRGFCAAIEIGAA